MEDPVIIRYNIEHYKSLLGVVKDESTRRMVEKLMAEAQHELKQATECGPSPSAG